MDQFKKPKSSKTRRNNIDGFRPNTGGALGASARPAQSIDSGVMVKKDGFNSQNSPLATGSMGIDGMVPDVDLSLPRHAKPKRTRSVKKVLRPLGYFVSVVAVSGLIVGGFVFGKAWLTANKILKGGGSSATLFNTDVKPELLKGEGDGRVNMLLVGIGGGNRDGANLTDTIMIASIDPIAKDVALLSLPRDLWVKVPNYWTMKINAAYSSAYYAALEEGMEEQDAREAGFDTLESVITEYIGIPIHYHALVNFAAFEQGVNAVGGIDLQVDEPLYDFVLSERRDGLIVDSGYQHFDGRLALQYSQSRSTSSDFARGERQREVIIALKEKVLAAGTFSNPKAITDLLSALGDNVTVNASFGELLRMYDIVKEIPTESIVNVGLTDEGTVLVTTDSVNDQSIVRPIAGLFDYSEVQSFVRNTLRDPFLKSENATVAVLNGSLQSGVASKKAEELRSYGYNVTIIDDAPTKDYAQTVVYDRTSGAKKYTKNYLENRLGAKVTVEPTSSNPILVSADFIVVLGENETTTSTN